MSPSHIGSITFDDLDGDMGQHDATYAILYSHPFLVESLLRGFLPAVWIDRLDFDTLQPVSEAHGTEDWSKRYNDRIWRLRWRDREDWVYFYLMLEFQSTDPPFMAARVLSYDAVLYQHLAKSLRLRRGERLPIILPLVIYNGERPWRSEQQVFDLIAPVPDDMRDYLPQLKYYLLDVRRLPQDQLMALNAAACVFRVDVSTDLEQGLDALRQLPELLPGADHEALRADILHWILELVLPSRLEGVNFPQVTRLEEIVEMMTAHAPDWTEKWRLEGRQQGRLEGRQQGRLEGRQQGRLEGRQQGRLEGRQQGESEFLQRMLTRKFGPLSNDLRHKIKSADTDQLLEWGERLINARSLDDVFSDGE